MSFNPVEKIIGKKHKLFKDVYGKNLKEPTYDPEPDYKLCNAGHPLVQVYNEKKNRYVWDCPTCIRKMERARRG